MPNRSLERICGQRGRAVLASSAPEFYRRHGYGVLAQIAGCPNGIVKFLMQSRGLTLGAGHEGHPQCGVSARRPGVSHGAT